MNVHFSERSGALRDFLNEISDISNICYFNYVYTGENIGRAVMGFEFDDPADHEKFHQLYENSNVDCKALSDDVLKRMLYQE